jgi:hypothetical protein
MLRTSRLRSDHLLFDYHFQFVDLIGFNGVNCCLTTAVCLGLMKKVINPIMILINYREHMCSLIDLMIG